jgi:hypothetical protein
VMSARPGRIKTILNAKFGAGDPRTAIDDLSEEIWSLLREEMALAS